MKRKSWKPSKEKLDIARNELGEKAAKLFHDKYRISKERCCNPRNKDYESYKDKWGFKDFPHFFDSCYESFKESLDVYGYDISIDRINGDMKYEPGNIRFVPMVDNLKNKSIVIKTKIVDVVENKTFSFNTFGEARDFIKGSGAMFVAMKKGILYRKRYLIMKDE